MLCLGGTVHRQREHVRAVERQPGPRVGSTRDLPAPQAREKLFGPLPFALEPRPQIHW